MLREGRRDGGVTDLDVQWARYGVADDQIHQCTLPRPASVQQSAEPGPEEGDARDL